MKKPTLLAACGLAYLASSLAPANAAEGFAVRYNMAGTVGGEMFAPKDVSGIIGAVVLTSANIDRITGSDGNAITTPVPGGVVPLPSPTPSALYPTYGASSPALSYKLRANVFNLALAYLSAEKYGGGQLAVAFTLPYATKKQTTSVSGPTPALTFSPLIPAATQAAVSQQFGSHYQSQLVAGGEASTGQVTGIGDAEVAVGWRKATETYKVVMQMGLSLPTGKYDKGAGPDIGFGNFYTLKPEVTGTYFITDSLALSARLGLGLNTKNRDNGWRSGNWANAELALGYKTSLGVIGVHTIQLRQTQNDSGTIYGANRYRTDNAGVFLTTLVPGINAALTAQYMKTFSSRNAIEGDYVQLRLSKLF